MILNIAKTKDELEALRHEWNQKLKDSGFEDIETPRGQLKSWHSHYFAIRHGPDKFEHQANYYYSATQFLTQATFLSKTDRQIWKLHSEGNSYRDIARRVGLGKDRVNEIVTGLKKAMSRGDCQCSTHKTEPLQLSLFEDQN